MLRRRTLLSATWAACAGGLVAWPSRAGPANRPAQAYPDHPLRLVVPYAVGIGPDVVARNVAEQLAQHWGQAVWVDNKPGASGIVAFSDVRRTAPDGHTLYLGDAATLAVNPLLHSNLPYDPVQDLQPLSLLFQATFGLWVGGGNPFRRIADLLDTARRSPGQVSYASLGNGHASHLAMETLARAAGVQMLHVPFKDAGALITAVVSGEVDLTVFSHHSVAGLMASGKLRPLAVAAARRVPSLPEVPTLAEAGGPPVLMHPWAALVTRAGTPPEVLAPLQQAINTVLNQPALRLRAAEAGFEITPSSAQALNERVAADLALYRPLVAEGRVARL